MKTEGENEFEQMSLSESIFQLEDYIRNELSDLSASETVLASFNNLQMQAKTGGVLDYSGIPTAEGLRTRVEAVIKRIIDEKGA